MTRTQAERVAARTRYREHAVTRAALTGLTLRCRELQHDMDNLGHRLCQGESHGGTGCLCRCHDKPAEIIHAGRNPS